jgi:PAS domain S-box-containing protein
VVDTAMAHTAIVLASRDGIVRFWSSGAERLFGYRAADIVGHTIEVLIPEEFRARHWAGWDRAWELGQVPEGRASMIPVKCADEATRRFAGRLTAVCGPRGQLVAAMAVWSAPSDADTTLASME